MAKAQTAGRLATRQVAMCVPGDSIAQARSLAEQAGSRACVVTDDSRVVLGLLDDNALQNQADLTAEQVMDPAPLTFRPSLTPEAAMDYMKKKSLENVLITTPDGRLIGLLKREAVE